MKSENEYYLSLSFGMIMRVIPGVHLAQSGNQSDHRILFIYPALGPSHVLEMVSPL